MENEFDLGKVIEIDQYQYRKKCEEGIRLLNSKENIRRRFSDSNVIILDFKRGSVLEFPTERH
jgi:hypothetical protein